MIRSAARIVLFACGMLMLGSCMTEGDKATAPEVAILEVRCDKPNTLLVTWTAKRADYYTAYWSNDSAADLSEWVKVENLATTTSLYDQGFKTIGYGHEFAHLVNGRKYFFRITANINGATRPSPIQSGIPVIQGPDSIRIISGNRRIILKWKDSRPGIRHFVYRSQGGSPPIRLEGGPDGLVDSAVENNLDYQYRVSAADSACESYPSDALGSRPTRFSEWAPLGAPSPPPAFAYSYYKAEKRLYEIAYFPQDGFSTRTALLGIRFTFDLINWGVVPIPDSLTKDARIIKHGDAFYLLRSRNTSTWGEPRPAYALDFFRSTDLSAWERTTSLQNVALPILQQAVSFESNLLLFSGPWQCRTRDLRSLTCDSASRYSSSQYVNNHEFVRTGDSLIEFEIGNYNSMRYASANLTDWEKGYLQWSSLRPVFPPGFYGQNPGSPPAPRKIVWRDGCFYALGDLAEGVLLYSTDGKFWSAVSVKPVQPKSNVLASIIDTEEDLRIYLTVSGGASNWFKAR